MDKVKKCAISFRFRIYNVTDGNEKNTDVPIRFCVKFNILRLVSKYRVMCLQ